MTRQSKGARARERKAQEKDDSRTARISITMPKHEWLRPDRTTSTKTVEADTDIGLLQEVLFTALQMVGFDKGPQLVVGAFASICNGFTKEVRLQLVQHLLAGTHMYINPSESYGCASCGSESTEDKHAKDDCDGTFEQQSGYSVHLGSTYEKLLTEEQQKEQEQKAAEEKTGLVLPPGTKLEEV